MEILNLAVEKAHDSSSQASAKFIGTTSPVLTTTSTTHHTLESDVCNTKSGSLALIQDAALHPPPSLAALHNPKSSFDLPLHTQVHGCITTRRISRNTMDHPPIQTIYRTPPRAKHTLGPLAHLTHHRCATNSAPKPSSAPLECNSRCPITLTPRFPIQKQQAITSRPVIRA
jgi:hypothetical protein